MAINSLLSRVILQDNQGKYSPETPPKEYNLRKCYLVVPTRYSRGILPLDNP